MTHYPDPGEAFGPYRVTGVLGRGGMGVVYSAVHEGLQRKVALKILAPELAAQPAFRRRFEREAGALASLYSPHIVDIYEHGEHDGCLYIATPFIDGGDLSGLLDPSGGLPPATALDVTAQVSSALADAHSAGVIHRDVKPSNVLIHRSSDGQLFAYLCDFGIAQSKDANQTRTEGLMGTLAYVAPERHQGKDATVASDVYSLGCLLYAALTGRPPFEGTDVEVAIQHLHAPVPTYEGGGPERELINTLLRKAMAKRPEDRYGSVNEVRVDLVRAQRMSEGDSSVVPPPSPPDIEPRVAPGPPRHTRPRRSVLLWVGGIAAVLLALPVTAVALRAGLQDAVACPDGSEASDASECPDSDAKGDESTGDVKCWNGVRVAQRTDCSQPEELAGLRWVFPSLDRDFERCTRRFDASPDPAQQSWWCLAEDGTSGEGISYTEWTTPRLARKSYYREYGSDPRNFIVEGRPVGFLWSQPRTTRGGLFKISMTYQDLPFSTSIYARSKEGIDQVCDHLRVRSLRTFRAVPTPCSGKPGQ